MSHNPYTSERATVLSIDFTFPMKVVATLLIVLITTVILWAVTASLPVVEAVAIAFSSVAYLGYKAVKYYRNTHRLGELLILGWMPLAPLMLGAGFTLILFVGDGVELGHLRFWRHVWLVVCGLLVAQFGWLLQTEQWNLWPVMATFVMFLFGMLVALWGE